MREMDLKDFCQEFLLDEKLFIVPTRSIGLLMINSMAREGGSALNLDPITLRRLSLQICQRYIETNEVLLIDDILGESLVLDCLKTLEKVEVDFFFSQDLIDGKTAQEVYKVIMELKSKKIENFPKEKDLDRIYKLYTSKLKELNAMDYCDLLVKALEVKELSFVKNKKICVAGNIEFQDLERDLFAAISKEAVKIVMPVEKLVDSPKEYFFKDAIKEIDHKKKICFFSSYGIRNEIKYIIDDIFKRKIPLDEIVISYTDQKYIDAIDIEFKKENLGISFADGLDVLTSTSYRFIKTLFEFAKNYYNIKEIRPMFFNGSLDIENTFEVDKDKRDLNAQGLIYEELIACKIFHGRENYEKLESIPEDLREENKLRRIWLRDFFKDVLLALPEEPVDFKKHTREISNLIKKYVKISNHYDEVSMDAILKRLRIVEKIPLKVSKDEYFSMVLAYIEEVNIERSGAHPSKVFACKYNNAGYTGRKHLYLIGLDSGSLANKIVESPILLDNIRRDISLALSFSKETYKYKKYKIKEALTASFTNISVGYSNFDMVEVKAKTPSKIYTELKEEYGHGYYERPEFENLLAKDLVFSGTDLEVLGQCSRKLYFKNKLGIREKEEMDMDIDRWLDPLAKGNLVHNVLNQYFDLDKAEQNEEKLSNIIERLCEEIEKETPYILEEVYRREKDEIREFCLKIIERQKNSSLEVFINELSFGLGKENRIFGRIKPQLVSIGDLDLSIYGAIDRVDVDMEEKKFKIIDYKTGSLKNFDKRLRKTQGRGKNKTLDYSQGQKFQFFIYKKAFENIIKGKEIFKDFKIESFSYEFEDDSIDLVLEEDFLTSIEKRIKELLEIHIMEKDKTIIYDENNELTCKYCQYKNICKGDIPITKGEELD